MNRFIFVASLLIAVAMGAKAEDHHGDPHQLPSFTEEREAAALVFARKHNPDVMKLLSHLKKTHRDQYERTIRELFKTSEHLAHLRERDPKEADLALKGWITHSQIHLLASQLARNPDDAEDIKKKLKATFEHIVEIQLAQSALQIQKLKQNLQQATRQHEMKKANRKKIAEQQLQRILQHIQKERAKQSSDTKTTSPKKLEELVNSLQAKDVAWKKIQWKTSLIEGIKASRKAKKPIILWVFIDRPIDDERC